MKQNIVLADCDKVEIVDFTRGLTAKTGKNFEIKTHICARKHSVMNELYRYLSYFLFPLAIFCRRKKYDWIIGWQQFFAISFCFYCHLLHVKKTNRVMALNFTYKEKNGSIGKIYKKFMAYAICNKYMDYIHVPSENYARECALLFQLPIDKFVVTPFGLPDTYSQWKNTKVTLSNYSLAIGRSNRDYDFLIDAWKLMPKNELLLIICDTYRQKEILPQNIILKKDVTGNAQFPYIINCKCMIIPIDNGTICSGDTVLLKAMSYYKPVVVTIPSTLGEMYLTNEEDGLLLEKDAKTFSRKMTDLLANPVRMQNMSNAARKKYEIRFSRKTMGEAVGEKIQ